MKAFLITLLTLVAFPVLAATAVTNKTCEYDCTKGGDCISKCQEVKIVDEMTCRTVTVCDKNKKPAPKKVVKKAKKKVIVMPEEHIKGDPKPEVIRLPTQQVVVIVEKKAPEKTEDEFLLFGPRLAVGLGARDPSPEALLGLRGHIPSLHLGAEVYTSFDFGFGLQALVYPIQGRLVNWHLNAGVLLFGDDQISTPDVPRTWDLTLGTGMEAKLWPLEGGRFVALTLDYRWAIPSPVFITQNDQPLFSDNQQIYGPDGRYLDTKAVLGNSLSGGHFLLGVLVQF